MKAVGLWWGVLLVFGLTGCASNGSPDVVTQSNDGDPKPIAGNTQSDKATTTRIVIQKVEGKEIISNTAFEPDDEEDVFTFTHVDTDHDWSVVIGSGPVQDPNHLPDPTKKKFEATYYPGGVWVDPLVKVMSGWTWVTGSRPNVRTKRVRAWSDGTGIIVQHIQTSVIPEKHVERVIFVAKTWPDNVVKVKFDGDPDSRTYCLHDVGECFELLPDGTHSKPKIKDRKDLYAIVKKITDVTEDRGLTDSPE